MISPDFASREISSETVSRVLPMSDETAPEHCEIRIDLLIPDERIEVIRFTDIDDPQQPVMRPRISGCRRLARTDACARCEQRRQEHCEQPRRHGRTITLIALRPSIAV